MNIFKTIKITAIAAGLIASGSFVSDWDFRTHAMDLQQADNEGNEELMRGAKESMYSMRLNEITGTIEKEWVDAAIAKADAKARLSRRLSKSIVWNNLGPDNVGGRTRTLTFDKDSLQNMWMGGVSGGLWKSNTGGKSWVPVTGSTQNQHVTGSDQTIDGTIFYCTGEGGFVNGGGNKSGSPGFLGDGIYKSTDRSGTSFERINNTNNANFRACNDMEAHPSKDEFYVATTSGLFKFTNGGTVNTRIVAGAATEVMVQEDGTIWVSQGSGLVRKSDKNGANFEIVRYDASNSGGRISMAYSEQDNDYVYLCGAAGNSSFAGVWRTKDGGINWDKIISPTSTTNPINNIFGDNNQGYYDNVIGVDPFDKDHIYMGGVILAQWDPINGYAATASTSNLPWSTNFIHSDKHIIQWDRRNDGRMMYVGTDGGIFRSSNYTQWQPANKNYTTTQFYNVAANYLGHVAGGTQDNGSMIINGNGNTFNGEPTKTSHFIYSGDGFDSEFSKYDPAIVFASTYYGTVARSSNGGQTMSTFWDQRSPEGIETDFNTTYTLWESPADSSSLLFLAKDNEVWLCKNPTDFVNDPVWFKAAENLGGGRIFEMDMTTDGDHLFFVKRGKVYRIDNIQSADLTVTANPTFNDIPAAFTNTNITSSLFSSRTITSVNVNQADANHLVITCGGYGNSSFVFETKNALDAVPTWKNITGDFINVPVYDAVIDPDDAQRIILATDLGMWATENGGVNYEEANDGMARVPVWEIRGYEWKSWQGLQLYIGTHGRGFYKSTSLTSNTRKIEKDIVSLSVYPNPASSYTNISVNSKKSGKATLDVFSISGRNVMSRIENVNAGGSEIRLDTKNFTSGTYFARITMNNASETVKVFVK